MRLCGVLFVVGLAGLTTTEAQKSTLGCSDIGNNKWERRLCFGPVVHTGQTMLEGLPDSTPTGAPPLMEIELNLTVTKRDMAFVRGGVDTWVPACTDALHVQFRSNRAIFGVTPMTDEGGCGVHLLRFWLPRDALEYTARVQVLHVDGEGLADPPYPRLFPENLVNHNDGPAMYNLRAVFEGALAGPDGYAVAESEWGSRGDSFEWRGTDDAPDNSAFEHAKRADWGRPTLPLCKGGDAPGRWIFHHSLLPQIYGEPLEWRPYGCYYRRYSGGSVGKCLERLGGVKLLGESTLGQMYELLQAYVNSSHHVWPLYISEPHTRIKEGFSNTHIRAQGYGDNTSPQQASHSEFHGMSVVEKSAISEVEAWGRASPPGPAVVVMLQGANDAARDSIANFELRLERFLGNLTEVARRKAAPVQKFVWINAPTRQYKAGVGPGMAVCTDGTLASCRMCAGEMQEHYGEVEWAEHQADMKFFWGTLDRRRLVNRRARAIVLRHFPEAAFIDYEALTDGLPSDYNLDGEHWGCPWMSWQNRHRSPFHCRSIGNVQLANIFVNVLCNDLWGQREPTLADSD